MINYRECMLFSPLFFFHDKILVKLKISFFQFVILVVFFFILIIYLFRRIVSFRLL